MQVKTLTAVFFLCMVVFSVSFEAVEPCHECSGTGCAVCTVVQIVRGAFGLLGLFLLRAEISFEKRTMPAADVLSVKNQFKATKSLVSQKIRMND